MIIDGLRWHNDGTAHTALIEWASMEKITCYHWKALRTGRRTNESAKRLDPTPRRKQRITKKIANER